MTDHIPPTLPNSVRLILDVSQSGTRLDNVLLKSLREQDLNLKLKEISRSQFKDLFTKGKVIIKGQKAKPSSPVARGITYVDILD